MAEIKDIDLFTKSIIRKQFALISACVTLPNDGSVTIDSGGNILYFDISDCVAKQLGIKTVRELDEYNFEQSAILLTAIQNRFNYVICRAVSDKWGLSPICFTVYNNTADRISNKHWEATMVNFARKNKQCGLMVGYDDTALIEPYNSDNKPVLVGTIKLLQATESSDTANCRAKYEGQAIKGLTNYAEILKIYGIVFGGNSDISFNLSTPFIKHECAHKVQPSLTKNNTADYYKRNRYFDKYYSDKHHSFAHSPTVLNKTKERLRQFMKSEESK